MSNAEYAAFLNALADVGLDNTHTGTHLLMVPMPAGRGGRLHRDRSGRWTVQPGYQQHPVYWVTWIGAASFAATTGARLPTRAECDVLTAGRPLDVVNAAYRQGDVTAVVEPGRGPDEVHHPVGNVQVWCADGPSTDEVSGGPMVRWLHGAAWNTPVSTEQMHRTRHRRLTGASRGVGIRLIRDGQRQCQRRTDEVARLLREWTVGLADRDGPSLAELDAPLAALSGVPAGLQTDVGLGTHV